VGAIQPNQGCDLEVPMQIHLTKEQQGQQHHGRPEFLIHLLEHVEIHVIQSSNAQESHPQRTMLASMALKVLRRRKE
jgi:hypothetical protein